MDTFGKRLKYAKEKKGLTNKELATLMGKNSPSTIISWENDTSEVTISQLKKLAEILEVSKEFLMDGTDAINIIKEPMQDYVIMPKDKVIELQDKALKNQEQQIQKQSQTIEHLKNAEMVVDKP